MIRYTLRCEAEHEHEAWFRSSADYEAQEAGGLIECATCGSRTVGRGLMAPALLGQARAAPEHSPPMPAGEKRAAPVASRTVAGPPLPPAMRALLGRMRSEIERQCVDVGRNFADEARRMHRGESAKRGIYGEATEADREALADEGVEIGHTPWLPRSDS